MRRYDTADRQSTGIPEVGDEGVVLGPVPAITKHVEAIEQGGVLYHRCEGCVRESIERADAIVRDEEVDD